MHVVSPTPGTLEEFWAIAGKNVVLWCIVYDDAHPAYEPLLTKLQSLRIDDMPTSIMVVNASSNEWIADVVSKTERPILIPFCGGLGVTAIHTPMEVDQNAILAVNLGRQLMKKVDVSKIWGTSSGSRKD